MVLDAVKLKVRDYMTPDPISIDETATLSDAVTIMARENIGNLVIEKSGTPSTVLTEREILSYVVKVGEIPDIRMSEVPTKRFAKVTPDELVLDAARSMLEAKRRLLVFDGEKLAGIITISDMLRGLLATGGNPPLDGVMRKNVHRCQHHDSIFKGVKTMYSKKAGSVLLSKNGVDSGIFTERDLLTRVLAKGIDPQEKLWDYSSAPLITAHFGIRGNDAAETMSVNKIKRLPLTKDDRVIGIVTARDIVDAFRRL